LFIFAICTYSNTGTRIKQTPNTGHKRVLRMTMTLVVRLTT